MLGGRVNWCCLLTNKTADRADIHDVAAWLLAEVSISVFESVEYRFNIDVHHAIEPGIVILMELAHVDDAGIVDQDVESTKRLDSSFDGGLHLLPVSNITFDRQRPSTGS